LSCICRYAFKSRLSASIMLSSLVEPALSRLWKSQVTLGLLIRCMPGDLWAQESETDILVSGLTPFMVDQTFRRAFAHMDWTKFYYYQKWIQHLGVLSRYSGRSILERCKINSEVFRAMTVYRPIRVFLPNLQSWASSLLSRNFLPFIDAFIGPNLTDIGMEWPQDDDSSGCFYPPTVICAFIHRDLIFDISTHRYHSVQQAAL
jgi:hypothetical protein